MSKRTWLGRAGIANLILGWMVMVACADEPKATGAEKVDEGQIGYSIFIMNSDGTALHAVCPMPEFTGQGSPSWSCDGKQIAFGAWKPASDEAAQVFVFTPEGKLLRELGPGSMPGFSPVSEELLISKYTPEWGTFWIPADGGKAEKLVAAIGPIWSPNGERLAFITPPGKGVGIYELGQEDLKPISAQLHHGGSWSPDGTQFCGVRDTDDGLQELVVVSVDSETLPETVLLKARMYNQAKWSPDGDSILVSIRPKQDDTFQLNLIPVAGGEPKLLPGQDPNRNNFDPAWSWDGEKIAFASQPKAKE